MFSKFLLVKISIKYLESKSMIIFLRHKWVAGDGVSITSYCRRLCPPPAIPYLEGGDRKNAIFYHHFFGWLTLVSFLMKCLILLCLLIYFGFDFLTILRGISRTRNKFAFWWQPIVFFLFIFLFLNNEYFCAHPIFAFYHLPYPSLSILPPQQQWQWYRDILDLHTTIRRITTKMK